MVMIFVKSDCFYITSFPGGLTPQFYETFAVNDAFARILFAVKRRERSGQPSLREPAKAITARFAPDPLKGRLPSAGKLG